MALANYCCDGGLGRLVIVGCEEFSGSTVYLHLVLKTENDATHEDTGNFRLLPRLSCLFSS